MKQKNLLCFFFLVAGFSLLFFSCESYSVRYEVSLSIYDDNNTLIGTREELKEFSVTVMDEAKYKNYSPSVYIDRGYSPTYYLIHFELKKDGIKSKLDKSRNDFINAVKDVGIKIEDKKGRYKTKEIYPFRTEKNELVSASIIAIKLEKR